MKPDQTIQHYTLHGTSWPSVRVSAPLRNVNKQLLVQTRCRVKSSSVVTVAAVSFPIIHMITLITHHQLRASQQARSTETREAVLWLESMIQLFECLTAKQCW